MAARGSAAVLYLGAVAGVLRTLPFYCLAMTPDCVATRALR